MNEFIDAWKYEKRKILYEFLQISKETEEGELDETQ